MNGPEDFDPAPLPSCPDCGREGTGTPIPGSPGEVECRVCSASWEPGERPHAGGQQLPAWQAERLAPLLGALGGIPISAAERASLAWLCGFEVDTVENITAVIRRARDHTRVLAARDRTTDAPCPTDHRGRLELLLDALRDVPLATPERTMVLRLAEGGRPAARAAASLIRRAARLRRTLDEARGEVITRHRETDLYRGQLVDLCERAGIDPGEDPHAALLAHLRGRESLAGELADAVAGFLAVWDSADASWRSLDAPVLTMRRAHQGRGSS